MPPTEASPPAPVPFVRISLSNAALLSTLYLGLGASLEILRRVFHLTFAEHGLRALETFPMRMLGMAGLDHFLVHGYLSGDVSSLEIRLLLNFTTVFIITVLALVVGFSMSILARVGRPSGPPPPSSV